MKSIHHGLSSYRIPSSLSSLATAFFYIIFLFGTQRECEGFQASRTHRTPKKASSSLHVTPLPEHVDLFTSFFPSTLSSASTNHHNLLESYGELLRTHPLATKSVTAGVLSTAGDAIAQYKSAENNTYDFKRGLVFGLFGVVYTGVFQHYWFPYLTSHVAEWGHLLHIWGDGTSAGSGLDGYLLDAPPTKIALAAGKVVINQMVMIPGLYMPIFLILTSLLGGLDLDQAKSRAASLYFPLVRRNWLFWFPTQFIQFFAIPTEWHIPFLSTASLVWTIILSTVGAAASSSTPPPPVLVEPSEETVDDVTGTDTIRVIDVVQNAVGRRHIGETEQSVLGATTTMLLVLLLAETMERSLESPVVEEEIQALVIATAGWIGWSLGPKFASTSIEHERPELAMARLPLESFKLANDAALKKEESELSHAMKKEESEPSREELLTVENRRR